MIKVLMSIILSFLKYKFIINFTLQKDFVTKVISDFNSFSQDIIR